MADEIFIQGSTVGILLTLVLRNPPPTTTQNRW